MSMLAEQIALQKATPLSEDELMTEEIMLNNHKAFNIKQFIKDTFKGYSVLSSEQLLLNQGKAKNVYRLKKIDNYIVISIMRTNNNFIMCEYFAKDESNKVVKKVWGKMMVSNVDQSGYTKDYYTDFYKDLYKTVPKTSKRNSTRQFNALLRDKHVRDFR